MYQYKGLEDTIAAIATPPGWGSLAVLRLSGTEALAILTRIFRPKSGKGVRDWPTFTVRYGWVIDTAGEPVDEVLVAFMAAPKSYTSEDMAEISCHGGTVAVKAVLELCLKNGARLAEPGEFTKRAFLLGRIDLAQAEAVLDVVSATSESFLRASTHQLNGELSTELANIRGQLMAGYTAIEAFLNFPEEDTDRGQNVQAGREVSGALGAIEKLLSTAQAGKVLREGVRAVICGKPNIGKSALLNALLRTSRAIVTDVAGTTRDVIEETAVIDGIPVNLSDTAGILDPRDKVEQEAVRRSRLSIQGADIVLLVLDQSRPLEEADHKLMASLGAGNVIVVVNKVDLPAVFSLSAVEKLVPGKKVLQVSALTRSGIDALEKEISRLALHDVKIDTHAVVISNLRHVEALTRAREALSRAAASISENSPFELASQDIKSAVNALDSITGRNVDDDLIEQIFSQFCIGK
jgi:tRNA modification GTPase